MFIPLLVSRIQVFNYNSCDGKLFVLISDDDIIRYAFTDDDITKPMTAEEYMAWGDYDTEMSYSNYEENRKGIAEQAQLMTADELEAFLSARYANIEAIKEKQTEEPDPNSCVTFKVEGRFIVGVKADTVDEAKKLAVDKYYDADFGALEDTDGEPVVVEDSEDNYVWEK